MTTLAWWTRMPRPTIGASALAGALILVVAAVSPSDGVSSFIVRIAELILAGGSAYLIDDAATAVTSATPPGVWRRRAPSLYRGGAAIGAAWAGIIVVLRLQGFPLPIIGTTCELVVLCFLTISAASVLAWRGEPEPGNIIAPTVLMLGLAAMIWQASLHVEIFMPPGGIGELHRQLAWVGAGLTSLLVMLAVSRDPARR